MAFSRAGCYPCCDRMTASDLCWCGSVDLERFSPSYLRCRSCGTLKVASAASMQQPVAEQETDLYGDRYYEHQSERYGYPSLEERARLDLTERCLHWLRTILKYRHPPANVLELGSAHGGFVGLLRWTGFDATGLELSPATATFAEREFGAPMLVGPLENHTLPENTVDLLILMDVLEHLVDPLATMRKCRALLRPGGFVLIQTPRVPAGKSHEELITSNDPFLEQLKDEQHLYLYGERGIAELLTESGCPHVRFEPAIFAHYDMFLVASPEPLTIQPAWKVDSNTPHPPEARLVQALLDMEAAREDSRHQLHSLRQQVAASDADRAARLELIESQGAQLGALKAERDDLRAQLDQPLSVRLVQAVATAVQRLRNKATPETGGTPPAAPRDAEQLAKALAPRASDRSLFSLWERHGFHVTPVHFYSAIPRLAELPDALWQRQSPMVGIDLGEERQLSFLLDTCARFKSEYDAFPRHPTGKSHEYYFDQLMFRSVDAEVLYCMVRAHRPRRLIEVGSGFSTLVSAAALGKNAETGERGELIAIEPYPSEILTAGVPGLSELRRQPVQDVDLALFASLRAGDILFIDSSHVLHVGSDVRFLFLEVLPRLNPGVLVHVHDIFLPAEYPREWILDEHRFWTEQYLLQAFLAFNQGFEVVWAGSFMRIRHANLLRQAFASFDDSVWPGSFWLRVRQPARESDDAAKLTQCES